MKNSNLTVEILDHLEFSSFKYNGKELLVKKEILGGNSGNNYNVYHHIESNIDDIRPGDVCIDEYLPLECLYSDDNLSLLEALNFLLPAIDFLHF